MKDLSMEPVVVFKAKVQELDKPCVVSGMKRWVNLPKLERKHLNQTVALKHPKIRSYVNADILPALLQRELKRQGIGTQIDVDNPPEGVTVDTSKFLAEVSIHLPH